MDMTISLDPGIMEALAEEAAARNSSCEQVVRDLLEDYFTGPKSFDPDYEAFFRAKVNAGRKDIEEGRIFTNEEVEAEAGIRRERLLAKIDIQK